MKVKLRVVHEISENPKSNEELRDDIVQFLCRMIIEEREMAMEGGKNE
jgi:hypothetical protein